VRQLVIKDVQYSGCVCRLSYPARRARALYYIVVCGLSVCITSLNIVPNTTRLWGGGGGTVTENEIYVLTFSTTFVWNGSRSKKNSASYYRECLQSCMQSTSYSC